jgi:hypothetical protein
MRPRVSLAVGVALAVLASARPGRAAVQIDDILQASVLDQAELESPNLTVGSDPGRLLIVVVATGNLAAQVQGVSWKGVALRRLEARALTAPNASCRLEVWTLLDPAPGNNILLVSLSTTAPFGLGAVAYSGVDQEMPLGPLQWQTGGRGPIALQLAAPGSRPVLGAACLGGPWNTGPTPATPDVIPGSGETSLWNFTEPYVLGVGSHRVAMDGAARVSWDITSGDPYQWLALGLWIKPDGEVLPDAAVPRDASLDQGSLDAPVERAVVLDQAVEAPDQAIDAAPGDTGQVDVHLRVGCACDTGGRRRAPGSFLLVAVALFTVGKPRRSPRASTASSGCRFFRL